MSISSKSIKIFVCINTFLVCLALIQLQLINYINSGFIFVLFIFRNYFLLHVIDKLSNIKQNISDMLIVPKEEYKYEFDINIVTSSIIESITHSIIITQYSFHADNIYYDLVFFVPISFLFELFFDLFHYIGHRTLHHNYLYKYIHKKHHKFHHPTTKITFYQDPFDIILTNSLPIILTLYIVPKMSFFQFNLIVIYKTYGEICGHTGKKSYPTSSFCQFIWLPKLLNIELYTEDHDLHHSSNNCNFSKRFSLWDRLFGTFRQSC